MMRSTKFVPLAGSNRPEPAQTPSLHAANAEELIEISVRVRRRTPLPSVESLGTLPLDQRAHLSREEFAAKHGADPADLDAVGRYAEARRIEVVRADVVHRTVVLRGKLGDLIDA